jgi:hypothetical protein
LKVLHIGKRSSLRWPIVLPLEDRDAKAAADLPFDARELRGQFIGEAVGTRRPEGSGNSAAHNRNARAQRKMAPCDHSKSPCFIVI